MSVFARRVRLTLACFVAMGALAAGRAEAQAPAEPASAEDTVLIPALKGLVFLASQDGFKPGGAGGVEGISAAGLPLLAAPSFQAQMKAWLGKPIRAADLQAIRDGARAWYVAKGHPLVEVTVPPQSLASGVAQVVVSEYRLGRVTVEGNRHFSSAQVLRPVALKPGQTVTTIQLQDTIDRLNENPFLGVDAQFRATGTPGVADLTLVATDRRPLRVYAGYDNQGVPVLGEQQWSAGFNWGRAFGIDQTISYQFTRAVSGRLQSHAVSDTIVLDRDDKLLVFGSYALLHARAEVGGFVIDAQGHSAQASLRFEHALPRLGPFTGHVQLGYDYRFIDNNAQFDQVQSGPPSAMETHQFLAVYDGSETDRLGSTSVENDLVYAPGRLGAHDTDAAFQALVPGAKATYVYDRFTATRTTPLPAGFSVALRGVLQRSSAILPYSEQLGGGGVGSVRGYAPDTTLGSNGELASAELRLPPFSPWRYTGKGDIADRAQFGLFYDYASLRQPSYAAYGFAASGGAAPQDLAGAGLFARYGVGRFVDLNLSLGWQLRQAESQTRRGSFVGLSLVFSR